MVNRSFYHLTSKDNILSIKNNGLRVPKETYAEIKAIFLFDKLKGAVAFSRVSWKHFNKYTRKFYIVIINLPKDFQIYEDNSEDIWNDSIPYYSPQNIPSRYVTEIISLKEAKLRLK